MILARFVINVLCLFVELMLNFRSISLSFLWIPSFLTSTAISPLRDQSEDLASAYANRAACLLRLACPQFALTDIELALENGSDLFFLAQIDALIGKTSIRKKLFNSGIAEKTYKYC